MNHKATETQSKDGQATAASVPSCLRGETSALPGWHIRELDLSLAPYETNPREGRPWREIRDLFVARRLL